MNRRLAWLILVVCACPTPVTQDVAGFLTQVSIAAVADDCLPERYVGDGGVQFFGLQKNGKPAISSSYEAFWGPARVDGGVIVPGSRQDLVIDQEVNLAQGFNSSRLCGRLFYTWSSPAEGPPWAMHLTQRWEAVDLGCDSPGAHIPLTGCSSTRLFTFSPLSDCDLSCVKVAASGDVTCVCGR